MFLENGLYMGVYIGNLEKCHFLKLFCNFEPFQNFLYEILIMGEVVKQDLTNVLEKIPRNELILRSTTRCI